MAHAESSRMAQQRAELEASQRIRYESESRSMLEAFPELFLTPGPSTSHKCYAADASHVGARPLMKLGVWIGDEERLDEGCNGLSFNALMDKHKGEFSKGYHSQNKNAPWTSKTGNPTPYKDVLCSTCERKDITHGPMTLTRRPLPKYQDRAIWSFPCMLDGRHVFALVKNHPGGGTYLFYLVGGGYLKHHSLIAVSKPTVSDTYPTHEMDLDYAPTRSVSGAKHTHRNLGQGNSMLPIYIPKVTDTVSPLRRPSDELNILVNTQTHRARQKSIQRPNKRPLMDEEESTDRAQSEFPVSKVPRKDALRDTRTTKVTGHTQPLPTSKGTSIQVWLRHDELEKKIRLDIDPKGSLSRVIEEIETKLAYKFHMPIFVRLLNVLWDDCEDFIRPGDENAWDRLLSTIFVSERTAVEVEIRAEVN